MKTQKILFVMIIIVFAAFTLVSAAEQIIATAKPLSEQVNNNDVLDVSVNIDMGQLSSKLGSFTAVVKWDSDRLIYQTYSGGSSSGFESPIVNDLNAADGKLVFANANPYGGEGVVNALNIHFKVVGNTGSTIKFDLSFTAMAAAESFENLLSLVKVNNTDLSIGTNVIPQNYSLDIFPNPFNPSTQIQYQVPEEGLVVIDIYNVIGQKVKNLANETQKPGKYTLRWNATDNQGNAVAAGTYFVRMHSGNFTKDIKIQLIK